MLCSNGVLWVPLQLEGIAGGGGIEVESSSVMTCSTFASTSFPTSPSPLLFCPKLVVFPSVFSLCALWGFAFKYSLKFGNCSFFSPPFIVTALAAFSWISSPGRIGIPVRFASATCTFQGSPPATDMSSLRMVADHFWCISSAWWRPSSVRWFEKKRGRGGRSY